MAALSVIVPCLNEAASLPELCARVQSTLRGLFGDGDAAELILVDDGSSDETWQHIVRLERDHARGVRGIRHPGRRGIPAAWQSGVAVARGEFVCVIDADLQYEPEAIRTLWQARAATDADVVQGFRAPGGRARDARLLLSRGLSLLLNLVFGMSLRDNKSGFFLCRREAFARLLAFEGRYRHWQCFVMVAAHRHGLRIHQVETPFHRRAKGRSAFGRWGFGPALAVAADLRTAIREYRGDCPSC